MFNVKQHSLGIIAALNRLFKHYEIAFVLPLILDVSHPTKVVGVS